MRTAVPEATALVGVFADGVARAFTIPGLKEVGEGGVLQVLDPGKLGEACISPDGSVVGWSGPAEIAVAGLFGSGVVQYVFCLLIRLAHGGFVGVG